MRQKKGQKETIEKETHIPFRLNVLFFYRLFFYFSAIIIQLGKVQIIDGETYRNEVNKGRCNGKYTIRSEGKCLIDKFR